MENNKKEMYYFNQKRPKSTLKVKTSFNIDNNILNNNIEIHNNHLSLNNSKRIQLPNSVKTNHNIKSAVKLNPVHKINHVNRKPFSADKKIKNTNPNIQKKYLRGKLRYLVKNNIILCENRFNPRSFTESISHVNVKEFKNRFRNLNKKNKVGIFTNRFPDILNVGTKFYTRYFDCFISPDELLKKNFNSKEIFQIKTDPNYFNFGNLFSNVSFFRKRTLKETLNQEEKIGPYKLMDFSLQKSLKQTKKRIDDYLNYYSSVMSRQGLIGNH